MDNPTALVVFPGNIREKPFFRKENRILREGETARGALAVFCDKKATWKSMAKALEDNIDVKSIDFLRPILPSTSTLTRQDGNNDDDDDDDRTLNSSVQNCVDEVPMVMIHFNNDKAFRQAFIHLKRNSPFSLHPLVHMYDQHFNVFELDDLPLEPPELATGKIMDSLGPGFGKDKVHIILGNTKPPLKKYNGTATVILLSFGLGDSVPIYGRDRKRHGPYYMYCEHCRELNSHPTYACPNIEAKNE